MALSWRLGLNLIGHDLVGRDSVEPSHLIVFGSTESRPTNAVPRSIGELRRSSSHGLMAVVIGSNTNPGQSFEDLAWLFTCDSRNRGLIRQGFDEAGDVMEGGPRHRTATFLKSAETSAARRFYWQQQPAPIVKSIRSTTGRTKTERAKFI